MAHHVHRIKKMGTCVLINGKWYKRGKPKKIHTKPGGRESRLPMDDVFLLLSGAALSPSPVHKKKILPAPRLLFGDAGLVECAWLSILRERRGRRPRAQKSIFAKKGLDAILFIN
jgi:hypothetical protein